MPDPINEVKMPAVSWQDFDDVVNSGFVNDDDKLDLIEDLYSNTAISHTGVWGRGWRMTESDKARCFEIRSALADAIRFKADIGPGKTTGNAVLDAILKRIEETQKPLTKREVRQVLNEVGKIVDIMSARRVLSASINKARDICRPGGQMKKLEGDIAAFRQKVMAMKSGQAKDNLLTNISNLMSRQNDMLKSFVSLCIAADKLLLATVMDSEAQYIDDSKTVSQKILREADQFEGLVDELKKLKGDEGEKSEKVEVEIKKQEPPKQPVVQKQEPPKNNLTRFVSNDVFKKDVLPEFKCNYMYGSAAYDKALKKHNEDIDTKLRKEILPNWTTLTSRLDALRQEAMKALGVPLELEDWFKHWHPEFDWSSDSFIAKVRGEKIGEKSVKVVEDAILAACQIKNTGKLHVNDNGESRVINLVVVVGKMKIKPADNTRYIYIDKENGSLTNDDVNEAIKAFCEKENLKEGFPEWTTDQIGSVLDTMPNISTFNVAFQECVKNPDAFDKLMKEEVDSLKQFTENERSEIAGLISKAVIEPIKNAKNIWNIEGLSLMRNFTEECKDNKMKGAQGIMDVVRKFVKKQVDANFQMRSNGSKCLLPVDTKVSAKQMVFSQYRSGRQGNNRIEMEPSEAIGIAIKNNRGLLQVGGNNCFMVSIVNALLCNEKGRGILKNCFCNGDGKYHFKDGAGKELVVTEEDVNQWAQWNPKNLLAMSKLERVIWAAWLKNRFETPDKCYNDKKELPGAQSTASDIAFLFGLSAHSKDVSIDGVTLPPSGLGKWVQVQKHLASGQFAVVHHGGADNGHYETITDVKSTSGVRSFGCCDSSGLDRSLALDRVQVESEIADPSKSQIILLTLPQDVA